MVLVVVVVPIATCAIHLLLLVGSCDLLLLKYLWCYLASRKFIYLLHDGGASMWTMCCVPITFSFFDYNPCFLLPTSLLRNSFHSMVHFNPTIMTPTTCLYEFYPHINKFFVSLYDVPNFSP